MPSTIIIHMRVMLTTWVTCLTVIILSVWVVQTLVWRIKTDQKMEHLNTISHSTTLITQVCTLTITLTRLLRCITSSSMATLCTINYLLQAITLLFMVTDI